jgi:hypothetical protein
MKGLLSVSTMVKNYGMKFQIQYARVNQYLLLKNSLIMYEENTKEMNV